MGFKIGDQTLDLMMQSSGGNFPAGRVNRLYGEWLLPKEGEVRENLSTGTLVLLVTRVRSVGPPSTPLLEAYKTLGWIVEDLRTGVRYDLRKTEIGDRTYNEMEVLAWAAK